MHIIYMHETIIKTILLYNYYILIKKRQEKNTEQAWPLWHLPRHMISAYYSHSHPCDDSLIINLILVPCPHKTES